MLKFRQVFLALLLLNVISGAVAAGLADTVIDRNLIRFEGGSGGERRVVLNVNKWKNEPYRTRGCRSDEVMTKVDYVGQTHWVDSPINGISVIAVYCRPNSG